MATGGLLLEEMPAEDRAKAGIVGGGMSLRVKHVGQYGPHAAAGNAGFRVGEVLVEYDGQTALRREADLLRHGVTAPMPGDRAAMTVLREGKQVALTLPMRE